MLINKKSNSGTGRVKFISYTGKWPNLCSGVLTLEIDGKEYKFGHNYMNYHFDASGNGYFSDESENNPNFNSFWVSGGHITSDYGIEEGEWKIDVDEIPTQFQDLAAEIDAVFNANVPHGCCGGCI